jgi:FkbM family methyltransferase
VKNFLKKISYNSFLIRLIRFFHLQSILRQWYFRFVRPLDNIFRVQIGDLNARFYVLKPEHLRSLESDKEGEGKIVEILISSLKPGDVVFDIGAHIGFYTILFAKAVGEKGKVIAFEPEEESFKNLENNLKLNDLKNALIFQKALGDESKESKLYLGQTIGNFSLVKTYEKAIESEEVEIVKGDQFVKEKNLSIPKLVKIDVEGYEYSVISGLSKTFSHPNCKIICCEVHPLLLPPEISSEKIIEIIKSFGFKQFNTYKRTNDYHLIAKKT